jgi:aryl-alcohol dehydrogenase-like predicted oxidoreductase
VETRPLGRTGLSVSEIGFGAWALGGTMWGGADDQASLAALARALELGVTLIDTALVYGDGRSERLVGRAVLASGWPRTPGHATTTSSAFTAAGF